MNVFATAAFFAFGSLLVLFGANATDIIRDLGLDYTQFGFVASMLSLGIGSGILSAGPVVDRLPRQPLFVVSCLLVVLASFLLDAGATFETLLASSFLIGFGAGFYETLLNTVLIETAGQNAPRRLLFIHSAATLGASVTPFLIALTREPLGLSWYDSFRAAGALHLFLLGGTHLLPARPQAHPPPAVRDIDSTAPNANQDALLALICAATFIYVGVESALSFFVGDFAEKIQNLPSDRASGVVGFFWIGLLIGRLAVGLAPREPSPKRTGAFALLAALVLTAFFAGLLPLPEFAIATTGFLLGGVFPIMIGLAGLTRPRGSGVAVGLAAGLGSLGGFAIPWITGAVATTAGLQLALASLGAWVALLAAACWTVGVRQES